MRVEFMNPIKDNKFIMYSRHTNYYDSRVRNKQLLIKLKTNKLRIKIYETKV